MPAARAADTDRKKGAAVKMVAPFFGLPQFQLRFFGTVTPSFLHALPSLAAIWRGLSRFSARRMRRRRLDFWGY